MIAHYNLGSYEFALGPVVACRRRAAVSGKKGTKMKPIGQKSTRWLYTAATLIAVAFTLGLAWLYSAADGAQILNALGFGATLAGVALTVGIFAWTAQTAARRVDTAATEDAMYALAETTLIQVASKTEHLEAIAERRALGESSGALAKLLVAVWMPPKAPRAARAYLFEGPDLWFVNSTKTGNNPSGGLRVERTLSGDTWKRRPEL